MSEHEMPVLIAEDYELDAMNPHQHTINNRILSYWLVAAGLVFLYVLLRGSDWKGSTELHTIMEVIAFFLAIMVGIQAMIRYRARKTVILLFVGMGFLGTGMLDGYHAVVTSSYFKEVFPSPPPSLIPWSWVASRLFLAVFLYLAYLAWRRQEQLGKSEYIQERIVYLATFILTIACFSFFALYPLPRAYYPEILFHRPEEFVPALFFALALSGFLRKGGWKNDIFEHWLVISLIVGLISQTVFMSFSGELFDMEFDVAHTLKKASYVCVLTGLFVSMYHIYLSEEKNRQKIEKAYEELKSSQKQLVQAERLSSLGQMVAGISHEVNTPLGTAVTNVSELEEITVAFQKKLEKGISKGEMDNYLQDVHDFSAMAKENLLRAAALVRSFKLVAVDQSSEEQREFDLKQHIEATLTTLHHEFKRTDIKIELDCPDGVMMSSYPGAISQIISNLMHNSRIHGFDEGMEAGKIKIKVSYDVKKDRVILGYRDNGAGLDGEQMKKIFDPFFTTRRDQGGSGLGMHVVHNLATDVLGGHIALESNIMHGVNFQINIPLQANV